MRNWKTGFAMMASCLIFAGCVETPDPETATCTFTGAQCSADNHYVETCVDGEVQQEYCDHGCAYGACLKNTGEACDFTDTQCADANTQVSCVNGNKMETPCTHGCVGNKCVEQTNPIPEATVPRVIGISPVSGKAGTKIEIKGEKLSNITKVFFASEIVNVDSATDTVVTATAPDLSGMVMVGVVSDNKRLTAGTFTYLKASENAAEVDWCQVTHVKSHIKPGEALEAYAQVFEEGVTGATGSHNNLKGQVGYMKADGNITDTAAYTWVDAARNDEFKGEAAANNDEYMSSDVVLGTGKYRVAYRFSLDGTNWQYCDTNGSQDGFSGNNAGTVTVAEDVEPEPPTVGWCRIMNGNTHISVKTGEASEEIYAQAFVKDCTNYQDHCDNLKAQVGFGSPALNAADVGNAYTWTDAKLNTSYDGSGGELHDEFMGTVKPNAAGHYAVVYRMTVDNGQTWTYCDTSDDVIFSLTDAMNMSVTDDGAEVDPETPANTVEWCRIVAPEAVNARANTDVPVYAQAYVANCTGKGTACTGLKGEVGYGKTTDKVENFTYTAAQYNAGAYGTGNNDEFAGNVKPTEAGNYAMAFRFTMDDGKTWTYCDYDNEPGFKMENASKLTVNDTDTIVWCRTILDGNTAYKGDKLDAYGQVWVENCSEGDKKCDSVKAQVGYGTQGDLSDFAWTDAEYNTAVTTGNNDEYMASIQADKLGTFKVAYRFSVDNGNTWQVCDADDQAEFNADNMATMTVKDPIEWCEVYMNSPQTIALGLSSDKIYGQAFVANCSGTDPNAVCTDLKAQIGYGTGEDPNTYTFVDAEYTKDVGYNDEFAAPVTPETVGEYNVVYAFKLGDGERKFCSLNGNKPFDIKDAGKLNVIEPTTETKTVEWCQIKSTVTDMLVGSEQKVYAQAFVDQCTATAQDKACDGLTAYVGYGKATDKIEDFTFTSAAYFKDEGNNDEFVATLKPEAADEYQVVFAFSTDGGQNKTYCTNENTNTFDKAKASTFKVSEPEAQSIGWCRIQYPETVTVKQGETSEIVYGRVFVKDCTEKESKCANVIAEAGYGTGEDMTKYNWTTAKYNDAHTSDNNDEYGVSFNISADTVDTTYKLVYRFSVDNGQNWTYCDFDEEVGFKLDNASKLIVEPVQTGSTEPVQGAPFVRGVDYSCGIDSNFANMYAESGKENAYYGQIYIPGCTDNGKCDKVVASHFHYVNAINSKEPIRTSDKWKAVTATYNNEYKGTSNDEYMSNVTITNTGNYAFAYSFDLKHNPSDANEKEQRVFCFINWAEYGFGALAVQ